MGVINDNNDDANAKDDYDDEGVGAAGGHGGGGGAGGVQGELRLGRQLDDVFGEDSAYDVGRQLSEEFVDRYC